MSFEDDPPEARYGGPPQWDAWVLEARNKFLGQCAWAGGGLGVLILNYLSPSDSTEPWAVLAVAAFTVLGAIMIIRRALQWREQVMDRRLLRAEEAGGATYEEELRRRRNREDKSEAWWSGVGKAIGWAVAMGLVWWAFLRPLQDAPEWARVLGWGLAALGWFLYVALNEIKNEIRTLKRQLARE